MLDHNNHRIRMCIWKQWKLPKTKKRNLIKMGVHEYYANMAANCRRGHWYCANLTTVKKAMTKERLINSGFYDLATAYQSVHVNYWNRRVPNGTHGGVRGRRLVTASYSIASLQLVNEKNFSTTFVLRTREHFCRFFSCEREKLFDDFCLVSEESLLILSILVDTFSSRISLTMPPSPKPHNTACVLS